MPLGETIGTAYVRVLADGTGFAEDAKRQFREDAPSFERMGHDSGDAYNRGWHSAMQDPDDGPLESLTEALEHGMGRFDAVGGILGDRFGDNYMEGLEAQLNERFPEVGSVITDNLRNALAKGDIGEQGLIARLHNIRREVAIASGDIAAEQARAFDELSASVKRYADGVDRGGPGRRELRDHLRELRAAMPRQVTATEEFGNKWRDVNRVLANASPKLDRFKRSLEGAGGNIGRAFGKGSRNNFLNFFGSVVGGIGKLTQGLSSFMKWPGLIGEAVGGIVAKWRNLVEESDGVGQALLNLGSQGLPGLIAAVATVAILVKTLMSLMGVFGAAIVLVSGLVLALAGSLAFALVGGLTAVAGALVPFAAAIGIAAIAMSGLDKKSKAFKTLSDKWKDLQKSTAEHLFGKDMGGLDAISGLLKTVTPLITGVADAMHGLLDEFGKATKSKGFQDMMANIADALPGMVTQIGHVAGNLGTFLGEAFVAAEPLIKDFLGWLDDVTKKLADFGKPGKGGKSGLSKFFEDAWDSAKIVGGVIEKIIKIVGKLFSAGKDTGDSIFQKLSDWLGRALTKLDEMQKDGTLQKMFDDAGKLAGKIGDIVGAVGDLIDALDTDSSRGMLFTLLDVITGLIKGITWVVTKIDEVNVAVATFALSAFGFFQDLVQGANEAGDSLGGIPGRILGFFQNLAAKIVTAAGDLKSGFVTWISGIWTTITEVPGKIATFFSGLATKIITAAGDLAVAFGAWLAGLPAQVITVTGQIIVSMINLAGRMILAAGDIIGAFTQWLVDLPGKSVQAAVDITVAFANLAIRIWNKAGNLSAAFDAWARGLKPKFFAFVAGLPAAFSGLAGRLVSRAGDIGNAFYNWIKGLKPKAYAAVTGIISAFAGLAGRIVSRAGSIASAFGSWLAGLPGKARSIVAQITGAFSGMASKAIAKAGSIVSAIGKWASGVYSAAKGVANDIVRAFSGLASDIVRAIGTIIPKISMPHITIPHITAIVDKPKAAGGIATRATYGLYGEAGPEAIVPLARPLSQVDPAVRMLSAFAQGKLTLPSDTGGRGKTIDIGGITINTPTEDPRAVASEVVAHMAAAAYI